jgi:hypothetical protein
MHGGHSKEVGWHSSAIDPKEREHASAQEWWFKVKLGRKVAVWVWNDQALGHKLERRRAVGFSADRHTLDKLRAEHDGDGWG